MSALRASWFEELRQAAPTVLEVATAVGLEVRRSRFGPCPNCGVDDRRHPPLTTRHGGQGWMCAHCKATGDAARLAAWVVAGSAKPDAAGWARVRGVLAGHGWCSGERAEAWTPPPRPELPPEPYPDEQELRELLRSCRPVSAVADVAAYCAGRGFLPGVPAAVLPDVCRWPAWWPYRGRPWRLVVSMVDAAGVVRGMHARATEPLEAGQGKTRWPYGRRATGLLFAEPRTARPMLRGNGSPSRVVVAEGMTDYLAATRWADDQTAILGAANGGFGALAQARIPRAATVYAWTDPDRDGDRYANEIARALPRHDVRRVDLRRMR